MVQCIGHSLMKAEVDSRPGSGLARYLSVVSAVRLSVAQLSHAGLRTMVTELVKQVLQVPKKLENRTNAKKKNPLVQGVKGMLKMSIGCHCRLQRNY